MQKFLAKNLFRNEKFNLLFITVIAAIVILPILYWGIPDGYDLGHHFQCSATFLDSMKSGNLYPSWALDRNFGYGGLEVRLYPPVSHYALALTELVVGNWHLTTWLVYSFWWILGCLGIYFLAREFIKPEASVFAAVLFSVIPYRINEIYKTFLYSEFAAGSILPFCFLFLTRIIKASRENPDESKSRSFFTADMLGFAITVAALILTHLPLTLIGIIALGIYFFTQVGWKSKEFLYSFTRAFFAGVLGLAASSFFWIKVLQERFMLAKTLNNEEIDVHYHYNYLLTPLQNYSDEGLRVSYTAALYDMVLLTTVLIVLPMAIIGFLKNRSLEKKLQRSLWIAFVFSIFISTVLSKPLWDTLPLIFEVQFPWRWLNVVSIFAPILAAGGFSICLKWYKNEKTKIYPVAVFGSILIGLALSISWAISTGKFISPEKTQTEIQNAIDDQGFKFWWTIWAKEDLKEIRSEKVSAGNRKIEITEWKDTDREFVVEEGQAARARVAVFYHPNWKVFINNQKFETQPDSSGAITFYVPPEKSAVSLKFVETKEVSLAKNISLAAWIFIPLLAVFIFIRKNRSENQ